MHFTGSTWTAISGAAAGGALVISILALVLQLIDRRHAGVEKIRNQADHISAWVSRELNTEEPESDSDNIYIYLVNVRNTSEEPVYTVSANVSVRDPAPIFRYSKWDILPPGETLKTDVTDHFPPRTLSLDREIFLTFRDARGNSWRRGTNGIIVRIDSAEDLGGSGYGGGFTLYRTDAWRSESPTADANQHGLAESSTTTKAQGPNRSTSRAKVQRNSKRRRKR